MPPSTTRKKQTAVKRKGGFVAGDSNAVIQTKNGERKFIGGAAMARLKAQKRPAATRIIRPDEKQRIDQPVPMSLNPFERFYAGVLRSHAADFLSPDQSTTWRSICQRLRLPVPEGPLPAVYPDGRQHFAYRASLVMEESRHAVAEGLSKVDRRYRQANNKQNPKQSRHHHHRQTSDLFRVKLVSMEQREKSGHTILSFVQEKPFTPEQMDSLRTGTAFACNLLAPGNRSPSVSTIILGSILPSSRDEMIENQKFAIMIFVNVPITQPTKEAEWELTPLTNLVTQQRMFEACSSKSIVRIPFLHPLLGSKTSTHTRFDEDDDGETVSVIQKRSDEPVHEDNSLVPLEVVKAVFSIPPLNETQEKAARSFLHSEANTISLVQGPPGTGKTTLLVSVICRYVMESIHRGISRSLMVCAPTNKAVSVLCQRFVETITENHRNHLPCNVILIGDEDKLINDGYGREHKHRPPSARNETTPLRSMFLYTWTQTVLDEYGRIRRYLTTNQSPNQRNGAEWAFRLSQQLEGRLERSLSLSKSLLDQMKELTSWLEQNVSQGSSSPTTPKGIAIATVQEIMQTISDWKRDDIWQQLLRSAHLIFCTLASSGAMIIKKSIVELNDLIVDEAAAATEPEIYIPFQYRPERLLAVGDPKQLPATVLSRKAEELGMSRSLHERLMYDCKHKHIMLDVQYRMRPAVSQFPSRRFYDSQLTNGQNVVRRDYCGAVHLLNDQPYAFLQTNGDERQSHSGSFENPAEAETVANLIQQLQRLSRKLPGKWHSADRIRVITFYQAQVSLIKRMLDQRGCQHVLVATVDSSQGCEADIVIVSFVRSRSKTHKTTVGFLSDDRRLNVAITRGKNTNWVILVLE
jgi:hypothetical protein